MKKVFLISLLISVIFIVSACSSLPVGDVGEICWGENKTETLVYSVIENNNPVGVMTLRSRQVPSNILTMEYAIPYLESDGSTQTKKVTVYTNDVIIECEMTFNSKYAGDSLKYNIVLSEAMQPIHSYRELTVDAYIGTLTAAQKENNTAVSYKTSCDYPKNKSGNIESCTFRTYISGAEVPYSEGAIAYTDKYQYDNDELLYYLRSLPISGNFRMNYSVFSPISGSLINLASSASSAQVTDIPYFEGSALNTIAVTVGLNQSLPGQSNVIHYSSDLVTVKNTAVKLTKVPLKIIQGNFSYVLSDITIS